ncbi:MAG: hypothetical protein BECKG1743E_GA0114224_103671, partial [Candidatus Kentron sp. G]
MTISFPAIALSEMRWQAFRIGLLPRVINSSLDGCNPSSAQAKQPMVLTLNRHWRQYQ